MSREGNDALLATPRTDAEVEIVRTASVYKDNYVEKVGGAEEMVSAKFARKLERELRDLMEAHAKSNPGNPFDTREFYELCQQYRHTPGHKLSEIVDAFEAVKDFGKRSISDSSPRWIPVSEKRLPRGDDELGIGGTYLVANDKGQVAPHIRGVIHNNVGSHWDWNYGESITHWMPLPEAPTNTGDALTIARPTNPDRQAP